MSFRMKLLTSRYFCTKYTRRKEDLGQANVLGEDKCQLGLYEPACRAKMERSFLNSRATFNRHAEEGRYLLDIVNHDALYLLNLFLQARNFGKLL